MTELEKLQAAQRFVKRKIGKRFVPAIGITLGSGLGDMADLLTSRKSCPYSAIPNSPVCGATGHAGRLWWGYLNAVPVIMMQGRVHLYEGLNIHQVVFLTRLMIMLGAKRLILTHATGAVTRNLEPCDIVGIRSHISVNCPDPTAGPGIPELGQEFTPMEHAYSPALLKIAKQCALAQRVSFHWGVSHWKDGRTYETLAETEAMARAGADVATMSTIPEVTAGYHMGAEILDLALVTDMGAGMGGEVPLSHEEVQKVAEQMKEPFGRLVSAIVDEMYERDAT
ncbi:MAG: hypothetical protein A3G00_02980 [Candidatus Magasanikbacteria bacterium RIFCSPLOWO2_12_FULL_43_12]|uniref:Purine nucleoside phosphorylase n=1 Tax=Candidatus Magasanikbacteria bacterium RIFCSPLOWO2_12_FULL_43_12 TaxID=1798692 RepID=A0A1F6MRE2_9BACT|nr:MAG: hypothetical protein A3G00_02980 [Candidatus Magasanikbacteria bacterium RIFCSPLOWO2_12_FULL_43_12]